MFSLRHRKLTWPCWSCTLSPGLRVFQSCWPTTLAVTLGTVLPGWSDMAGYMLWGCSTSTTARAKRRLEYGLSKFLDFFYCHMRWSLLVFGPSANEGYGNHENVCYIMLRYGRFHDAFLFYVEGIPLQRNIHLTLHYLLTYCPSCHRQLGQQQILSISGGLEPVPVRFPMNVPCPRFLCPSGFPSTATLGMEPWSLCNIWPIHLQCLRAIVVSILSCWHSSKRSWFEIFWG